MTQLISPLIALVLTVLSFGGAYYLYYDVGTSAALIKESHDQLAAITARDAFAKTAAQFLAETTVERNAVQFFLIPQDGTAQAIELVEAAGKLAGVKATVGDVSLAPQGTYHERVLVSVSAEGTYAGLARFATVLESLPRGATLQEVAIHATERGWYGTYTVGLIKQK